MCFHIYCAVTSASRMWKWEKREKNSNKTLRQQPANTHNICDWIVSHNILIYPKKRGSNSTVLSLQRQTETGIQHKAQANRSEINDFMETLWKSLFLNSKLFCSLAFFLVHLTLSLPCARTIIISFSQFIWVVLLLLQLISFPFRVLTILFVGRIILFVATLCSHFILLCIYIVSFCIIARSPAIEMDG